MGVLDSFLKEKKDHEKLCDVARGALKYGNSICVSGKCIGIYHSINFSFSIKSGNDHKYETSSRLCNFITKACEQQSEKIIALAMQLSEDDLKLTAKAAVESAKEVLSEVESIASIDA